MDKYESRILVIVGVILSIFLFSILWSARATDNNIPECIPYSDTYLRPKITRVDSTTYQVFCVAKMWSFEPSEIYLPVGSEVDFFLTSKDVVHGFHIVEKNVNMMAIYGSVNKTTVTFDKPGVYRVVCHEYCGTGHQQMQSEIIVNYPKK